MNPWCDRLIVRTAESDSGGGVQAPVRAVFASVGRSGPRGRYPARPSQEGGARPPFGGTAASRPHWVSDGRNFSKIFTKSRNESMRPSSHHRETATKNSSGGRGSGTGARGECTGGPVGSLGGGVPGRPSLQGTGPPIWGTAAPRPVHARPESAELCVARDAGPRRVGVLTRHARRAVPHRAARRRRACRGAGHRAQRRVRSPVPGSR